MAFVAAFLLACTEHRTINVSRFNAVVEWTSVVPNDRFDTIRDADWIEDSTLVAISGDGGCIARVPLAGRVDVTCANGDGPGEFRELSSVTGDDRGHYIATDGRLRRLLRWSNAGTLLGGRTIEGAPTVPLWLVRGELAVKLYRPGTLTTRLVFLDSLLRPTNAVHRDGAPVATALSCGVCNMAVANDGSVFLQAAFDTAYVVRRFNAAGDSMPSLTRTGVPLIARTQFELDSGAAMRQAAYPQMRASGIPDSDIRALLRNFKPSRTKPPFVPGGIHVDDSLNGWLQRSVARGAMGEVDVFDAGGQWRAIVKLPSGVTILRTQRGRLLGVQAVEDGPARLVIFRSPLSATAEAK